MVTGNGRIYDSFFVSFGEQNIGNIEISFTWEIEMYPTKF